MKDNMRNAILHFLACILFIALGCLNIKANMGMTWTVIYFVVAAVMGFLAVVYFSRRKDGF